MYQSFNIVITIKYILAITVSKNKIVCISDGALNQIKYELFTLEHGTFSVRI